MGLRVLIWVAATLGILVAVYLLFTWWSASRGGLMFDIENGETLGGENGTG